MIELLISGGQTGVDQGGLDFAIEHGIAHGSWVPRGRKSETGPIPPRYQMKEHPSPGYPPRTEANVLEADATVIFPAGLLNDENGCLLTASLCVKHKKPFVVVNLKDANEDLAAKSISELLRAHPIKILNVAGARGSRRPDVGKMKRILEKALLG